MELRKNELEYFHIDDSYGGNQDWLTDHWMHIGGCAALAACDSCIQLEKTGLKTGLYPYAMEALSKEEYIRFGMKMKPYIRPRWHGVDKLDIYLDGMGQYLKDMGNETLQLEGYSSDEPLLEAKKKVMQQIDQGFPIPYLLLRHKNPVLHDFLWHWFMIVGYRETEEELYVKTATYGEALELSFDDMWQSGYENNGGMIIYH